MTQKKDRSQTPDSECVARVCVEVCEERQAADIRLYDVRECSLMTDFYLICSASSTPHIRGICANLDEKLSAQGVKPDHVDGTPESRWIVVDYGGVLVHVFHPDVRQYYQLESLWEDAALAYDSTEPHADT